MGETSASETGHLTGTKDKDYDLLWYVESCLNNALRLETYLRDAERGNDRELVELFGKAQADSRKGAEMGKRLLAARLSVGATPGMAATTTGVAPGDRPHTDAMAPAGVPGDVPHEDAMAAGGVPGDEPHVDAMAPSDRVHGEAPPVE
jgi:hypothetical protein